MSRILITFLSMCYFSGTVFSQEVNHMNGGRFLKKIEYNINAHIIGAEGRYNLAGKSVIDRIFFGVTNSPVEFVLETSFNGASAFRIIQNPSDHSFMLEVMRLPDGEGLLKTVDIVSAQTHEIHIPGKLLNATSLTLSDMEKIREHNKEANLSAYNDDLYKPYRPKTTSLNISKELAEKLHSKMAMLINDFRAEGIPPTISDGYTVTFRCVVKDELWTLNIHMPQQKALLLSEICKQIIIDAETKKLTESKYLESLGDIR